MKNQYADPKVKNNADDEEIVEQEEIVNSDEAADSEEAADSDEEVIDGEEHEWVNPTDLDAVDPEDIGLGEEYF